VELAFQLGRITEQERDEILNTPRIANDLW